MRKMYVYGRKICSETFDIEMVQENHNVLSPIFIYTVDDFEIK